LNYSFPQQSELRSNAYIVWNEFIKNIKFLFAYPIVIAFWAIFPVFMYIPFIFEGEALTGGLQSTSLAQTIGTSNYIPFIVIGSVLYIFVSRVLHGMGESIRRDLVQGTLDYMFIAPCNKMHILIGKALSESVESIIFALSQLAFSILLFGLDWAVGVILPLFFVIILLILGVHGLALILAGLSLLYKQSHELSQTIGYIFYVFSPVRYPVETLPAWAQIISGLLPLTYALVIARSVIMLGTNFSTVYLDILALIITDILLVLAGFYMFNWAEKKTRKTGTISNY
jgi:ABC-2 type transport system permease protein